MSKCVECRNCGHIGYSLSKGNIFILIALAFLGFIPAVIYYFWSVSGLGRCSHCYSTLLVPSNRCPPQDKLDPFHFMAICVLSAVGAIAVVIMYAIGDTLWQRITMTDEQKQAIILQNNFESCKKDGVEYLTQNPQKLPPNLQAYIGKYDSLIPAERLKYVEKTCRQAKTEFFPK